MQLNGNQEVFDHLCTPFLITAAILIQLSLCWFIHCTKLLEALESISAERSVTPIWNMKQPPSSNSEATLHSDKHSSNICSAVLLLHNYQHFTRLTNYVMYSRCDFYRATLCLSAVFAVAWCPSVCLSV